MEGQLNFLTAKTPDNKTQFINDGITITVDQFSHDNDKHHITDPQTAHAHFVCCGEKYMVENTNGCLTVEDWYARELLPKYQMLTLLGTTELI